MNGFPVSGLVLRTHPDDGYGPNATFRVVLEKADAICMHDGETVYDWPILLADVSNSGLGGLDSGTVVGDAWYEVYAIRKSSDNSRGLIFHRRKNYALDQNQLQGVNVVSLRDNNSRQRLAQGFKLSTAGKVEVIDIPIKRVGNPSGNIWFQIESDAGGVASGVPIFTSDKMPINKLATATTGFNLRSVFRSSSSLDANTQYWKVLCGDYAISSSNYVQWYADSSNSYSNGRPASYDGSTWTLGTNDQAFKIFVTKNEDSVVMPSGYDQRALIGFFYTNIESPYKFDPMIFNGRRATWQIRSTGAVIESFSNTMALVKDSNIVFPHGLSVTAQIAVSKPQPGIVIVAGGPEGYLRTANDFDNAVTGKIAAAGDYVACPDISSEFGCLYALTDTGTATVMVPAWEW